MCAKQTIQIFDPLKVVLEKIDQLTMENVH